MGNQTTIQPAKGMKGKRILILLITAILLYFFLVSWGYQKTEYQKKPIVKEKVQEQELGYLYDFYIVGQPSVRDRAWYGDPNAPITIIMYAEPLSATTNYFFESYFPVVENELIKPGIVRFLHKNHITMEDKNQNNQAYQAARALTCVLQVKPEAYYQAFAILRKTNSINTSLLQEELKLPDVFVTCMATNENRFLLEEISEVDNFGMIGLSPRFYIGFKGKDNTILEGIPSMTRFKRTIKEYQIQIGK
ncbi:MAG: thioredoxin domain-containing protein [Candidatus Woesearchaeota archaeon]